MISVSLDELVDAVEFVSSGMLTEHRAYIAIDTGAIFWVSDSSDIEDDAPDDLEESDRYIAVPSKADLGLGRMVALRFTEERLPSEYDSVQRFFARRGAYGRFKDLLAAHGQLDAWYVFEAECTERALLDWCETQAIKASRENKGENHGSA
jgi:Uncharacterised protein family (UPF0158)